MGNVFVRAHRDWLEFHMCTVGRLNIAYVFSYHLCFRAHSITSRPPPEVARVTTSQDLGHVARLSRRSTLYGDVSTSFSGASKILVSLGVF